VQDAFIESFHWTVRVLMAEGFAVCKVLQQWQAASDHGKMYWKQQTSSSSQRFPEHEVLIEERNLLNNWLKTAYTEEQESPINNSRDLWQQSAEQGAASARLKLYSAQRQRILQFWWPEVFTPNVVTPVGDWSRSDGGCTEIRSTVVHPTPRTVIDVLWKRRQEMDVPTMRYPSRDDGHDHPGLTV